MTEAVPLLVFVVVVGWWRWRWCSCCCCCFQWLCCCYCWCCYQGYCLCTYVCVVDPMHTMLLLLLIVDMINDLLPLPAATAAGHTCCFRHCVFVCHMFRYRKISYSFKAVYLTNNCYDSHMTDSLNQFRSTSIRRSRSNGNMSLCVYMTAYTHRSIYVPVTHSILQVFKVILIIIIGRCFTKLLIDYCCSDFVRYIYNYRYAYY